LVGSVSSRRRRRVMRLSILRSKGSSLRGGASSKSSSRVRTCPGWVAKTAATQDGGDAGFEFHQRERLRQKIVGADFEARDPVESGLDRGQHEDARVMML